MRLKRMLFLMLIVFMSSSKVLSQTTGDTAKAIGSAIANMFLAYNSLSEQKYCDLKSILLNENLSDSVKHNLINSDVVLSSFSAGIILNCNELDAYTASMFLNDTNHLRMVTDSFEHKLGEDFIPMDGCGGWKAGRRVCNSNYSLEMGLIYSVCIASGAWYYLCYLGLGALASNAWAACHASNDAAHPACASGSSGVIINPWLGSYNSENNCEN